MVDRKLTGGSGAAAVSAAACLVLVPVESWMGILDKKSSRPREDGSNSALETKKRLEFATVAVVLKLTRGSGAATVSAAACLVLVPVESWTVVVGGCTNRPSCRLENFSTVLLFYDFFGCGVEETKMTALDLTVMEMEIEYWAIKESSSTEFASCNSFHLLEVSDGAGAGAGAGAAGEGVSAVFQRKESLKKQKTLSLELSDVNDGLGTLTNFTFNEKKVRELAAHMVLLHEYLFHMMDHELFNKFMRACTPYWKKISRATIKSDCIATYNIEKKKLKTLLSGIDRVNITIDMWTSSQRVSYMVVTCHFVDSNWLLQKRILNFCNVPPPHSGVVIVEALRNSFIEWGILDKVFTIIVDNASANAAAIDILRDDSELRGNLPIGGLMFHVRCYAHITNLLVQARFSKIGDIIDSVRQGIKYIVASERRLNIFSDIAKRLDLGCNKLILDVPTRWNNTYLMLKFAIRLKEVFPGYHRVEHAFLWIVSPEQWDKVENVNQVLVVSNDVTNVVSGSDYPTSNLFLPEVWSMKEIVDIKAADVNDYIRLIAAKMSDKFDKYWGESNMVMALAAVLDPRYKMKLIRFCFPIIYPLDVCGDNIKAVLNTLKELFEVYVAAHNASIIQQQAAAEVSAATTTVASVTEVVLVVDHGLDNIENGEDSDANFDALGWWESNALKYRILSKMARDVLVVPISTVASESSFSAGGRVIEPHRASLSIDIVQMLLCDSWH
ncbi:zinc finger BED domain-containing protein RICESLEEPER 2-like [Corylus avellana]|uniref:zinc finger BED domain-containing protein RICESLEEPER 2-like n=1 Tax=Corylus avellana TaxID=13451 RepID=UPI00286B5C6F|nr:zinc finger BED domain-containing protein RICESLEEPER 2-like [Corylus avellana]